MTPNNLYDWLTLIHAPGIGFAHYKKIQKQWETIADLNRIPARDFQAIGLSSRTIAAIKNPDPKLINADLKWLNQRSHHLITIADPRYSSLLREISDPPLALYLSGNIATLNQPQLAIVGSRNPSQTGLDNSFDFANCLAAAGITITSGCAQGIDTASHKGALAGRATTIAVMGTGLNTTYPANNKSLAKKIVTKGGALISEFPVTSPPKANHFPRRNRVISGLSLGVIVIEATIRSGSLITARLACEQNREVFAVPGSIHNPLARGCHQLIQQGAKLVTCTAEVVEEIGPLLYEVFNPDSPVKPGNDGKGLTLPFSSRCHSPLAQEHEKLLQYVGVDEPTSIDTIIERSGMPANKISAALLILELEGYIQSKEGGFMVER